MGYEHPVIVGEVPTRTISRVLYVQKLYCISAIQYNAVLYALESSVVVAPSVLKELWKLSPSGFPNSGIHPCGCRLEQRAPVWRRERRG